MQLTLVVPGLLDLPASALASVDAHAPALSRLLARSDPPASEQDGLIAGACRACGIDRQDDWPVAPRLARAMGIDPGNGYWLCAEPATLAVSASDVRLSWLVGDLAPEDAQALLAALNGHFAADGVAFIAPTARRWFVRAAQPQRLTTRPPEAAFAAPLFSFLPAGPDAPRWRRWQNEIQMLFFDHPVNVKRERAGQGAVNSVWFWGGGTEAPRRRSAAAIFASDPLVVDLACGSALAVEAPPPGFDAIADLDADAAVVWLDPLAADGVQRQLEAMDRAWMAPVERALAGARLSGVEIALAGRGRALRFVPRRGSLAQRWRARLAPPRGSQRITGIAPEIAEL